MNFFWKETIKKEKESILINWKMSSTCAKKSLFSVRLTHSMLLKSFLRSLIVWILEKSEREWEKGNGERKFISNKWIHWARIEIVQMHWHRYQTKFKYWKSYKIKYFGQYVHTHTENQNQREKERERPIMRLCLDLEISLNIKVSGESDVFVHIDWQSVLKSTRFTFNGMAKEKKYIRYI